MTTSFNIVIAEDQALAREHLRNMIVEIGHNVVATCEGGNKLMTECIRLHAENTPIDLIITDISMQETDETGSTTDVDGDVAIQRLHSLGIDPVVLFVTTYTHHDKGRSIENIPSAPITIHKSALTKEQLEWTIPQAVALYRNVDKNAEIAREMTEKIKRDSLIRRAVDIIAHLKAEKGEKCTTKEARALLQKMSMDEGEELMNLARSCVNLPAFAEVVSMMPLPRK